MQVGEELRAFQTLRKLAHQTLGFRLQQSGVYGWASKTDGSEGQRASEQGMLEGCSPVFSLRQEPKPDSTLWGYQLRVYYNSFSFS